MFTSWKGISRAGKKKTGRRMSRRKSTMLPLRKKTPRLGVRFSLSSEFGYADLEIVRKATQRVRKMKPSGVHR